MSIPYNTSDTTRIRVTMLIYNALGELDDSATASGSELQTSINGAAWTDASGTLESTGDGAYYYQGVLADAGTLGTLKVKFAKSGFLTSMSEESVEDTPDANPTIEGSYTRDDLLRIIARTLAGKMSKDGSDYTYRDLTDTKDSHTGTVTGSGRIAADIVDPT